MKILITGITGFAGSHLADYILENHKDVEIFGIARWRSRMENVEHLKERIKLVEGDIRDYVSIRKVIEEIRPELIFHLAAQSFVPTSWRAPQETLTTNIIGETNLFESVRETKIEPVIQIAGSSEEYGLVNGEEIPIKETHSLRPLSPYAVSKIAQDFLGYQYFKSYNMRIVRTRGFNHTGPRRGDVFVCSNFARQVAMMEAGKQEPIIRVGNLNSIRDFTDVRDMVRGYWLAATKGEPGDVYNICSGKGYKMREILDHILSLSKIEVKVEVAPDRLRPSDVPVLIGDSSKFREKTGWSPEIPIEKTLEDLLNYWRERV